MPENEIYLDSRIHDAWHILFGNLLVEEVIDLIQNVWSDRRGVIKEKYLAGEKIIKRRKKVDKRVSAWETIFGETRSAEEAVRIIQKIFTKRA